MRPQSTPLSPTLPVGAGCHPVHLQRFVPSSLAAHWGPRQSSAPVLPHASTRAVCLAERSKGLARAPVGEGRSTHSPEMGALLLVCFLLPWIPKCAAGLGRIRGGACTGRRDHCCLTVRVGQRAAGQSELLTCLRREHPGTLSNAPSHPAGLGLCVSHWLHTRQGPWSASHPWLCRQGSLPSREGLPIYFLTSETFILGRVKGRFGKLGSSPGRSLV